MKPDVIDLQYIVDCLPVEELLCQLAEEAAELAQAALKLRRCYDKTNPARITASEAFRNLQEEIADVWLCLQLTGMDGELFVEKCNEIMHKKAKRWVHRLEEADE